MRLLLAAALLFSAPAAAEVTASSADGFTIRLSGLHPAAPDTAWKALVDWGGWWPDSHSYSGKADNFDLDVEPDGELEEEWDRGSVLHGSVVNAQTAKLLRLHAAFGPLQALPVNGVLDFALAPEGQGTRITLTYRVGGPASAGLPALAAPVNEVFTQAFARLLTHSARPEKPEDAEEAAPAAEQAKPRPETR
jgi:uncharacterized protein YndB with AHSA1/START domain